MSINTNLSYLNFLKDSGVDFFLQDEPNNYYKLNKTARTDKKNIEEITSLEELKVFVKQSTICDLKKNATQTVFSDGNPNAKIMLIGEAPGAEEDRIGKPFVGAAGQLLNKMLAAIELDRNAVYLANIIPWRPPNNRTPSTEEILQCLPFIQKHIEIINPKLIVLLGSIATKAILTTTLGITKLRGQWNNYNTLNIKNSIPTISIYHPAFLLRSPSHKKETWEDLKKLQKKIKNLK